MEINITKAEMIMLDEIICDYFNKLPKEERRITNAGILKICKLRFLFATHLLVLPKLSKQDSKQVIKDMAANWSAK